MAYEVGWRMTCQITAAYGMMLAVVVMCTVREPARAHLRRKQAGVMGTKTLGRTSKSLGITETISEICRSRLVLLLFTAASVRFMGGYALGSFLPRFYAVAFPGNNITYSYINAVVVSLGGALSSFVGGRIVDRCGHQAAVSSLCMPLPPPAYCPSPAL